MSSVPRPNVIIPWQQAGKKYRISENFCIYYRYPVKGEKKAREIFLEGENPTESS